MGGEGIVGRRIAQHQPVVSQFALSRVKLSLQTQQPSLLTETRGIWGVQLSISNHSSAGDQLLPGDNRRRNNGAAKVQCHIAVDMNVLIVVFSLDLSTSLPEQNQMNW